MTESPAEMTRRILAELYPSTPSPFQAAAQALERMGEAFTRAMPRLTLALALAGAGHDLRPDEGWEYGMGEG